MRDCEIQTTNINTSINTQTPVLSEAGKFHPALDLYLGTHPCWAHCVYPGIQGKHPRLDGISGLMAYRPELMTETLRPAVQAMPGALLVAHQLNQAVLHGQFLCFDMKTFTTYHIIQ